MKLQEIIDLCFPETFGSQIVYLTSHNDDSPEEEFGIRIPHFQKLSTHAKAKLLAFILETNDYTPAAIADALRIDRSQISRWRLKRKKEDDAKKKDPDPNQEAYKRAVVFLTGLSLASESESGEKLFEVAEKYKIHPNTIFRWQGELGMVSSVRALTRIKALFPRTNSRFTDFAELVDKELIDERNYWRDVFRDKVDTISSYPQKYRDYYNESDDVEPPDVETINTILAQKPHPDFSLAYNLVIKKGSTGTKEQLPPTDKPNETPNPVPIEFPAVEPPDQEQSSTDTPADTPAS